MQTHQGYSPIGDRILVLRDRPMAVTDGGIVLAEASQDQPVEGTVLKLGTAHAGELAQTCPVKPGDRVIFTPYVGERLKIGDKNDTYLIMRPDELLVRCDALGAPQASPELAATASA